MSSCRVSRRRESTSSDAANCRRPAPPSSPPAHRRTLRPEGLAGVRGPAEQHGERGGPDDSAAAGSSGGQHRDTASDIGIGRSEKVWGGRRRGGRGYTWAVGMGYQRRVMYKTYTELTFRAAFALRREA